MYLKAYRQNLFNNDPEVSENSIFYFFIHKCALCLVPCACAKVLDLQYSHTFITSNSCLHLPTLRSQAAIVSEKSTVFTFSHRKAYVAKFDLVVKNVKVTSGSSFVQTMMGRSPQCYTPSNMEIRPPYMGVAAILVM